MFIIFSLKQITKDPQAIADFFSYMTNINSITAYGDPAAGED